MGTLREKVVFTVSVIIITFAGSGLGGKQIERVSEKQENKSQVVKLLESDNVSFIRSALNQLKVVDDDLLEVLREILQSGYYRSRILVVQFLTRAKGLNGRETVEVEFPKPMFVGGGNRLFPLLTEEIYHAQKYLDQHEKLFAPRGIENVSLGKKVTSSDPAPIIGDIAMVTDGDKTSVDGSYLEIGPGVEWITIDLGERCGIYWIGLWHQHRSMFSVYSDVIVQISEDEDFAKYVTLFNNDHDGSSGFGRGADLLYPETNFGKWICGEGLGGQYVRLYSNGNTSHELNQYCEVEVWGLPLETNAERKKSESLLVPLPIELPKPVFQ